MSDMFFELGSQLLAGANRPNVNNYVPHEKQQIFHKSSKKIKLFAGGNRSGKTTGGTVESIYWLRGVHPNRAVPIPPIRARAIGVDFREGIEKIIKPEFQRWIPPSLLKNGSWDDSFTHKTNTLTLTNGSFIEFMSYEQEVEKFAGTSRHFIYFDEEPPKAIWHENKMRLVDTHGSHWITMTPVNGMTWLYDDIYLPGVTGLDTDILVVGVDIVDNPHIQEEAVMAALKGMDEREIRARRHGKFLQIGGTIFPTFGEKHIKPPVDDGGPSLEYLKTGKIYCSLDHGLNNPTAWLWHSVFPDGTVITFHEHYRSEWTIDKHADYVKNYNTRHGIEPELYVGDPAIKQRNPQTGLSVQVVYSMNDIPIALGNNDYEAGFNKINSYLNYVPPKWLITMDCPNLIKQMRRYKWAVYKSAKLRDENNRKERPHKKDDHCCDSARYLFSKLPDLSYDLPSIIDHRPSVEAIIGPVGHSEGEIVYDTDFHSMHDPDPDFAPVDEYLGSMY